MRNSFFSQQPASQDIQKRMASFGAWFEVDLDAISANLHVIRDHVGVEIMPVVKNNAYGHGLRPICETMIAEGITWLMVAKHAEAIAIRSWKLPCQVVNMDALYTDEQARQIVEFDITEMVCTLEHAHRLNDMALRLGRKAGIFVKIDTGLHRVGVAHERAAAFMREIADLPAIEIRGTFSTFMQDPDQDRLIVGRFETVLDELEKQGVDPGLRSLASSHAIFHYPESWLDMVRPALALFGIYLSPDDKDRGIPLRQALTFKARVEELKFVKAGESVTYFGRFVAPKDMKIGTVHVGFYDGVPREMTNRGTISFKGQDCASVGAVSLNHYLFDATDVDVAVGDEVTIIGRDGTNDIAATAETAGWMVYSLLNHLNPFLPRIYFRGGVPVAILEREI